MFRNSVFPRETDRAEGAIAAEMPLIGLNRLALVVIFCCSVGLWIPQNMGFRRVG